MSLLMSLFGRDKLASAPIEGPQWGDISPRTSSGVRVNESTAFNYSVCWAATRLLAGTAGWLPFNLYKRLPNGGANIASDHIVHRLIHDKPNNEMGAMMFRAQGVNHQVNWGNTFSEIVRTNGGQAVRLEPIHPSRIPPQNIRREDDRLVYYVNRSEGSGKPQRLTQEYVFHVPSILSENGIIGKGVVTAARESIGKAIGTQKRGASAINHGGAPPLALKNGKFKTKEDREDFRRQINEVHGGPENAGKWLMLPADSEVQMLGFSLEDSQFIESENFDVEEMARWYGVPPHLVGHLLRATFNNIEELGISFVKYSLIQWLKLWEQEVWLKLLSPREQEGYYAKFVVDALERGNLASRTEAGVKKFFNGLWSLNDWASQEDMNPIEETAMVDGKEVKLGDMRFVQKAMIPLAQAAKGPPEPAAPVAPKEEKQDETKGLAAVAASTTTLALSVERIVAAVGELKADSQRLAETVQAISVTVGDNHQTIMGSVQAIATAAQADREQSAAWQTESTSRHEATATEIKNLSERTGSVQRQLSEALVRDVMARLLSVEIHNVKNIAQEASRFDTRLSAFYDKHRRTMELALVSPVGSALAAAGMNTDAGAVVRDRIEGHVSASMQQLLAVCDCQADELPGKVEACVSKWHEERATVTL